MRVKPRMFASMATASARMALILLCAGSTPDISAAWRKLAWTVPTSPPPPPGWGESAILNQLKVIARVQTTAVDDVKRFWIEEMRMGAATDMWTTAVASAINIWSVTTKDARQLAAMTADDVEGLRKMTVDGATNVCAMILEDAKLLWAITRDDVINQWKGDIDVIKSLLTMALDLTKYVWTNTMEGMKHLWTITRNGAVGLGKHTRAMRAWQGLRTMVARVLNTVRTKPMMPTCGSKGLISASLDRVTAFWMETMHGMHGPVFPVSKTTASFDQRTFTERPHRDDIMSSYGKNTSVQLSSLAEGSKSLMAIPIYPARDPELLSFTRIEPVQQPIIVFPVVFLFLFLAYINGIVRAVRWLWRVLDLRVTINFGAGSTSPRRYSGLGRSEVQALEKGLKDQGFGLVTISSDGNGMFKSLSYNLFGDGDASPSIRARVIETFGAFPDLLSPFSGGDRLYQLVVDKMGNYKTGGAQAEVRVLWKRRGRHVKIWLTNLQTGEVHTHDHQTDESKTAASGSIDFAYLNGNEHYFKIAPVDDVVPTYSDAEEWVCPQADGAVEGQNNGEPSSGEVWSLCVIRVRESPRRARTL